MGGFKEWADGWAEGEGGLAGLRNGRMGGWVDGWMGGFKEWWMGGFKFVRGGEGEGKGGV
jgi:hypothetical protein